MRRNTAADVMLQLAPMLTPGLPEPLSVRIEWHYDEPGNVLGDSHWWGHVHVTSADFEPWLTAFGMNSDTVLKFARQDGYTERFATKGAVRVMCLESSES